MFRLTPYRLNKAKPILEKYRSELHRTGEMDASAFELELRECFGADYQQIKGITDDLSKIDEFVYLAAYYMEFLAAGQDEAAPAFQAALATLYGADHYGSKDCEEKRAAFWSSMPHS